MSLFKAQLLQKKVISFTKRQSKSRPLFPRTNGDASLLDSPSSSILSLPKRQADFRLQLIFPRNFHLLRRSMRLRRFWPWFSLLFLLAPIFRLSRYQSRKTGRATHTLLPFSLPFPFSSHSFHPFKFSIYTLSLPTSSLIKLDSEEKKQPIMMPKLSFVFLSILISSVSAATTNGKKSEQLYLDGKKLPDDFLYGCGTSAYQIEGATGDDAEGGKGASVWDTFAVSLKNRPAYFSSSFHLWWQVWILEFELHKPALLACC